jgi:putative ABC transport system permease protein
MKIEDEGNIATLAPKLYVNTNVKETSVMLVGIDPQEELNVRTWWEFKQGEYINQADQALVGAIAAQLLQFNVGDKIDINGREVTVASILGETGASDDYQIFLPLGTLQQTFNKEGLLSSVDIRALCNACPVEMISNEINKEIPGVQALAVKQIAASEMGLVERMNMLMLALAGITLVVGLFGVVNTMITSVHERVKDIGIMRAVGASQAQIIRIFVYEAIVVGILGGIFGYAIGTLLAFAIGPAIFEGAAITFVPQYLPLALALATFIAVLATVYPAFRATKIRVADSFRSL